MKEILIIASLSLAITAGLFAGFEELTKERGADHYRAVWNGHGWDFDKTPPDHIASPWGFMHNLILEGKSYTLTIPRTLVGDGKARVTIWPCKSYPHGETFR